MIYEIIENYARIWDFGPVDFLGQRPGIQGSGPAGGGGSGSPPRKAHSMYIPSFARSFFELIPQIFHPFNFAQELYMIVLSSVMVARPVWLVSYPMRAKPGPAKPFLNLL